MASLRLTGIPAPRLAARWRIRRSPPEQGSSPTLRAEIAASQSMAAIAVPPVLVPWLMKRPVKSLRARNDPWLMRSSAPASAG